MLASEIVANNPSNDTNLALQKSQERPQAQRAAVSQTGPLAQIVTLILQSPNHRHFSLSDLEWMVLPPMQLGQIALAESKPEQNGSRRPLAAVFWATVSPEIDRRMSSNLDAPIRLRPDEWRSGDILWIADMIGDMRTGHSLVKSVLDTVLAGRKVKVRSLDSNGKRILLELTASSVSVIGTTDPQACSSSGSCPPNGTLCASCITTGCTGRCRAAKEKDTNQVSH